MTSKLIVLKPTIRDRLTGLDLSGRRGARAAATLEVSQVATRHEIPLRTPDDLCDEMPHFLAPASGARISSRLLTSDVAVGRMSPANALILFGTLPVLLGFATRTTFLPFLFFGILAGWCVFLGVFYAVKMSRLAAHLQGLALPGDGDMAVQIHAALSRKTAQCERAFEDKSDVWTLGRSTHRIGGIWGADKGRQIGLSARDLTTHLLVTGATGSGKTSGVLRPLAQWWAFRKGGYGLLVMDGKGDLPREFEGKLPGFRLLVPGRDAVDLLAGLEPHDICMALAQKKDDNDFWSQSASELLYQAAVIAQSASQKHIENGPLARYDLMTISRVLTDSKFRASLCLELSRGIDQKLQRTLFRALTFFAAGFDPEKSNTQAGVLSTASSWVNNLLRHPALLGWAAPDANDVAVDLTTVLDGGRFGLDVPEYRYGDAAASVTALLRAQVYRAAKTRGSAGVGHRQTLVLIDEAALALGPLEAQILPVARSLGLSFACATQNIEQFAERFGGDGSLALIDQFRSLIQLVSSQKTSEYTRLRTGNGITTFREPSDAPAHALAISREATGDARTWSGAHEQETALLGLARKFIGMRDPNGTEKPAQKLVIGPLIQEEIALGDGEAVCVLNRAGALRVETVQLNKQY